MVHDSIQSTLGYDGHQATCWTQEKKLTGSSAHLVTTKTRTRFDRLKQEMQRVTRQAFNAYVMDIFDQATDTNSKRLYSYVKSQKKDSSSVGPLQAPMARRTHPQVGKRTSSTNNLPPSSLLRTKMICRSWSPHHTKRCLGLIST